MFQYIQTVLYLTWYKIMRFISPQSGKPSLKEKVDEESADEGAPPL